MKKSVASLVVAISIMLGAWSCNPSAVIDRINSIITAAIPAVQLIVSILPLFGAQAVPQDVVDSVNKWAPEVQGDLTKLKDVIAQYQSDLSSASAQAAINSVIQTTEQDITSILPMLHVLNPETQAKITALVNSIGAAVQSVEAIVNAAGGKAGATRATVLSGDDFKKKFNAELHKPTGNSSVDQATSQVDLK